MSFEKQFPSLKGKDVLENFRQFDRDDIQEHCLDKTKVKEVITAYLCKYSCRKNKELKKKRDGILKELGL